LLRLLDRVYTGDKIDFDSVAGQVDKVDLTVDFLADTGDKVKVDVVASVYAA